MLYWYAKNGNIVKPRVYLLAKEVPRKFEITHQNMRTYIQLWGIMFTTEPKE